MKPEVPGCVTEVPGCVIDLWRELTSPIVLGATFTAAQALVLVTPELRRTLLRTPPLNDGGEKKKKGADNNNNNINNRQSLGRIAVGGGGNWLEKEGKAGSKGIPMPQGEEVAVVVVPGEWSATKALDSEGQCTPSKAVPGSWPASTTTEGRPASQVFVVISY